MITHPRRLVSGIWSKPIKAGGVLLAVVLLALAACHRHYLDNDARPGGQETSANLKLLSVHRLSVKEPSGVAMAYDRKSLWMVSDETQTVHQVTFDGKPIREFRGLKDMEGITVIDESTVAVIGERSRVLAQFDVNGNQLRQGIIDFPGHDNNGPEGVAFDPVGRRFFVVKEKSPGMLVMLDEHMKEVRRHELGFALDYSDLAWDPVRKHLWVLSHESKTAYVLDEDLNVLTCVYTGVPQQEGLYVDYAKKRLYIVCDRTEKLYVFEFADY